MKFHQVFRLGHFQTDRQRALLPLAAELGRGTVVKEELQIIPMRADEFRCDSCFLIHHRSQLVAQGSGRSLCRDCA